jgi:DNA-binding transcriptional LysR family regulator
MFNLDLNLLRTFDALIEHRSVTRAASHLGVTQSAVSHALARLRNVLDDQLFIREQNGLQPTARAEEMAGGVRRGLLQFQDALARTAFDPASAERHFTIAAGSYFCTLLIPALIARVRREAPGISLRLVPVTEMLVPLLDQGAIDLAFGASFEAPVRLVVEPLYEEKMVWIAARGNPIADKWASADVIDHACIKTVPGRPFETVGKMTRDHSIPFHQADQADWEIAVHRRGSITVYDSSTAVALIARTDLVACVPKKVAALAISQGGVVALDHAPDETSHEISMIWHAKQRSDPGMCWLRDKIREAVSERPGGFG